MLLMSGCRAVGLSGCRAVGLSGCRAVGLSGCRAVGLSGCRAVGLSGCRAVGLFPFSVARPAKRSIAEVVRLARRTGALARRIPRCGDWAVSMETGSGWRGPSGTVPDTGSAADEALPDTSSMAHSPYGRAHGPDEPVPSLTRYRRRNQEAACRRRALSPDGRPWRRAQSLTAGAGRRPAGLPSSGVTGARRTLSCGKSRAGYLAG